ncbi:MAG: hypothetical protein EBY39_08115 [Flavobacteriia bacterium]|nr:hypothetical protein [Flavobacteriia bacterium]
MTASSSDQDRDDDEDESSQGSEFFDGEGRRVAREAAPEVLTASASIFAFLLPLWNSLTLPGRPFIKKSVRFAKDLPDAVKSIANASGGSEHPDFIIKMVAIKNRIYTFYAYSTDALRNTLPSGALDVSDDYKALSGVRTPYTGSVGYNDATATATLKNSDHLGHNLMNWTNSGGSGGNEFMVNGKQVIKMTKSGVQILEPTLVKEIDPSTHPKLVSAVIGSIKTNMQGAIGVKATIIGEFNYSMKVVAGPGGLEQIGGVSMKSAKSISSFYQQVIDRTVECSPATKADALKIAQDHVAMLLQKSKSGETGSRLFAMLKGIKDEKAFYSFVDQHSAKIKIALSGKDAQIGFNPETIDQVKPATGASSVIAEMDPWVFAARCLSMASVAAAVYKIRRQRRSSTSGNAEAFCDILNLRRMAAQDYITSMLGEPLVRPEIPPTLIDVPTEGIESVAEIMTSNTLLDASPTEPSLESMDTLRISDSDEPSLDAPSSSGEEREAAADAHVREAYFNLRMSDFLFEGVKTRNITAKDKDSIKLAHQKLQSQFRNMFK